MHRVVVQSLMAIGTVAAAAPLAAQWRVGLGLGREVASGFSRSLTGDERSFVPYRPLVFAVRLETSGSRLRGVLEARYAKPDISVTGAPLTVVLREDVLTVLGVRPAVSLPVARLARHVAVRGELGPVAEIWAFEGQTARWRWSGEAGLSLEVGLGGRVTGLLQGSGSLTPTSPFGSELPGDFERRSGWRWGLRGVALYRLD